MSKELYETLALGMRYWFLFLMLLIVWRSYRWLVRDRRQRRKRLRLLPDAGMVGEWVVLSCEEGELRPGDVLPVPVEGVLGSIRSCDAVVPVSGVRARHLWFNFDEKKGLYVEPMMGCTALLDGETVTRRSPVYLAHGACLTVGACELRLRMFAGYEHAGLRRERAADAPPPAPVPTIPPEQMAAMQRQQLLWQQQMMIQQQAMAMQQAILQQQAMQAAQAHRPIVVTDAAYRPPADEYEDDDEDYESDLDDEQTAAAPYPEDEQPDKSLYVEPSDSDRADALVWNRLLGRRRDE